MEISGTTKVLGIIGNPVSHSQSPKMHNAAFKILGLDYLYAPFPVTEKGVEQALEGLRALHIAGCNVTMPCKQAVIPFLDSISPEAELMGAVNTIVNQNGVLCGHNTDGYGMIKGIQEAGGTISGASLLLFGTGGASTAIGVEAAAQGAKQIYFVGRKANTNDKLKELTRQMGKKYPNTKVVYLNSQEAEEIQRGISESDILVNATPVGMKPLDKESPLLWPQLLTKEQIVADAVYNPRKTLLLQQGEAAGARVVDGLSMLLWQGARAFKLFTGRELPVEEVQQALFPRESL